MGENTYKSAGIKRSFKSSTKIGSIVMRKTIKVLGLIALVAVIGFGIISCDDGGGDPPGGSPQKATYVSEDSNGNKYTLEINETGGARSARSVAQSGDTFKLTVEYNTNVGGGNLKMTFEYSGTVGSAQTSGASVSLTLAVNGEMITITIVGTEMKVITGKIKDNNGQEIVNNPGNVTPVGGGGSGVTYNLGDTGPGGGKVFYYSAAGFTMTDTSEVYHYLEAAPAGISGTLAWASSGYVSTNIPNTGTAIGSGRKNTALILAADANAPAAKACKDYRGPNNLTDWFLPSKNELEKLYENRSYAGITRTGSGHYSHWSSSQSNASNAWDFNFNNGYQQSNGKSKSASDNYVRAIRAFSSGSTNPTTYAVTVVGGSGSNSYAPGATVTITANTPPSGQQFTNWTVNSGGATLSNANSTTTTFTMPSNTVTVTANFSSITYNLGDTGPGGGKVFYYSAAGFTMTDTNQVCHYLEAAPANMEARLAWASSGYAATNISGTGMSIGTGRKNTALILATDANAPAAKACKDYRGPNNLTDWFLPSENELRKLYENRSHIGGYNNFSHWSSSQGNSNNLAFDLNFANNYQQSNGKTKSSSDNWVRAIRAF